jgi:aspartate aminotransferase
MFANQRPVPDDPILGLIALHARDPRPGKIDLGVGVYRDPEGRTPIMAAVRQAEALRLQREDTKTYLGMAGDAGYNAAVERLLFAEHPAVQAGRVATVQTPGGTGALRVAAELIRQCQPTATVWLSTPTWANHAPVFRAAGLRLQDFPYFDPASGGLRFDDMLAALAGAARGDVVVLHGCCHNPSGVDLSPGQWVQFGQLAQARGLVPLVDLAYQGLGLGLDDDAAGLRHLLGTVDELIACSSCSKNFGLYRERTGSCSLLARTRPEVETARSLMLGVVRNIYSMPPAHGAAVVRLVLESSELAALWRSELTGMRTRLQEMRGALAERLSLASGRDFGCLARQRGMFSFLGLSRGQVDRLREDYGVYMVDSSRINVAGLNPGNLDRFVAAVTAVLDDPAAPPATQGSRRATALD